MANKKNTKGKNSNYNKKKKTNTNVKLKQNLNVNTNKVQKEIAKPKDEIKTVKKKRKLKLKAKKIIAFILIIAITVLTSIFLKIEFGIGFFVGVCIVYIIYKLIKSRGNNKQLQIGDTKKKDKKIQVSDIKKEMKKDEKEEMKIKKSKKKNKFKKFLKILLLLFLVFFILGVIAIILFLAYIVSNAPEFDEKKLYVYDPTIVLDKNGKEIGKLGTDKRITITYDEIPEVLIDAIVATEDSRFFEHKGVDLARFSKAAFYQLLGKDEAGGASTLTMQLSKNNYTSKNSSGVEGIIRKFTDVYVSMFKIEKKYTKEQIMEFYVNSQYLGKNTYGVEQISLTYFGKSAKDINVAEAALIAGLFQAPERYNPYNNPEITEARRQRVLKLMLRHGYINKKEYEIAKKLTVEKIVVPQDQNQYLVNTISPYQAFIDTAVEEVQEKTGKNPYTTSMIIYTTIDTSFQDYINDIMNGNSYYWSDELAQAGIAVINVKDGSIAAIGGNRNNNAIDNWNYATDIENQIGSTAKPLYDYGPAVEYNHWSSGQPVVDEPISYSDGTTINNWDGGFEGFETIRWALGGSRNIPALKAFKATDKSKIIEFVSNLGLTPEIYSCPDGYKKEKKKCINRSNPEDIIDANKANTLHEAHAIGGYNGESPLSMASAYATFANGGVHIEPYSFTKVVYQENGDEFVNEVKKTKAMSEETAYIITDMLLDTAPRAMYAYYNINGIRYAAKTGTTNYDEATLRAHNLLYTNAVNDLWVIGYNTEYAIGVWYGFDEVNEYHHNYLSSGEHERLFQAVGRKIFTNGDGFNKPDGVVEITIERECAEPMYPSENTPSEYLMTELFIKGYEPATTSNRFEKLRDVTNLTAEDNNGVITLTWNAVEAPKQNTEAYLKNEFSKVFQTGYINSFVRNRIDSLGEFGYEVYVMSPNDTKFDSYTFTLKNTFTIDAQYKGEYSFLVKTAYKNFKVTASDGISTSVSVTKIKPKPIIPGGDDEEPDDEEPDDDEPTT